MKTLRVPYWPYDIFRCSTTPPGLYARQKWLKEESSPLWMADFDATVAVLRRGQSEDGLWAGSPIETIHRLFGLHLTVRTSDTTIKKGLYALMDAASAAGASGDAGMVSAERLRGLPFAPGNREVVISSALLFLAAIFGCAFDPVILERYDRIAANMTAARLEGQDPAALNNTLRALVVHPHYGMHAGTQAAVNWLADRQTPQGDWGPDLPFYQVLNALAHVDMTPANRQCQRAFDRLVQHQNLDGGWGETDRQWNTFLAVHALRNRGLA